MYIFIHLRGILVIYFLKQRFLLLIEIIINIISIDFAITADFNESCSRTRYSLLHTINRKVKANIHISQP